jgi:hypothetical protein
MFSSFEIKYHVFFSELVLQRQRKQFQIFRWYENSVTVVSSTCKVMMRGPLKFLNRDEISQPSLYPEIVF